MSNESLDAETEEAAGSGGWITNRPLLIAWLLVFFPVGLYGLWKGELFDKRWKVGITVAILVAFFGLNIRFFHPAYVLIAYPAALYLMWKAEDVRRSTVFKFASAWVLIFVLFALNNLAGGSSGFENYGEEGGSCTAVMKKDNCTYYRDSDCNVIARECS